MTDLFKKLNVLLRASLNDLASIERNDAPSLPNIGKRFDRDLKELHQRIDEAYAYESELNARIATLEGDVNRLDDEVDQKIAERQEDAARHIAEQSQRAKQRLSMAQSDLREHKLLTQELVMRVSELEYAVEQVRKKNSAQAESKPVETRPSSALDDLSAALRGARASITGNATKTESPAPPPNVASPPAGDDLESRRQRLSKR